MLDKIFGGVFGGYEDIRSRRRELVSNFALNGIFKDEYHVLYVLVKENPFLNITEEFLEVYLRSNRAKITNSKFVNISHFSFSGDDSEAFAEFSKSVVDKYKKACETNVSLEDYELAIEAFKMDYVAQESISVLESGAIILSEGATIRGKKYSGYDDMRNFIRQDFRKLDNLVEKKDRRGTVVYGVNDNEYEEEIKYQRVGSYGIPTLDSTYGGIYEGDMISLLAPAKGGKTRLSTYMLHNCLVNGTNVLMWSIENGLAGWENLIRARHFNWLYNKGVTDVNKRMFLDDAMLMMGAMDSRVKEMELASWSDLKTNPSYGRLASIDEDFNPETFMAVLDDAIAISGAKLICVDYLQLVHSKDGKTPKNEVIQMVYQELLQYLKKKKIAGIFPAQYKQEAISSMKGKGKGGYMDVDLRDSAAGSSEVIRTPDINISLYGTVEDIKLGNMTLIPVPARRGKMFDPIPLFADMGTCTFAELKG